MRKGHTYSIIAAVMVMTMLFTSCSDDRLSTLTVSNGTADAARMAEGTDREDSIARDTTDAPPPETTAPQTTSAQTTAVPETTPPETTGVPETDAPVTTVPPETQPPETKAPVTTAAPVTKAPAASTEGQTDTVYWVKNGEVWHLTPNCSSLSRSTDIQSGSVSDAQNAGKDRVCKRCGGGN